MLLVAKLPYIQINIFEGQGWVRCHKKRYRVKSVHLSCIFNLSLVDSSNSIVLVWSFEIGVKWSYVSGQEQVVIFSPCVVVRKFNVCQMNISCKSNLNIAYNQIQKEKNYLFQNLSTFSKKFTIALKRKMMRLRRHYIGCCNQH